MPVLGRAVLCLVLGGWMIAAMGAERSAVQDDWPQWRGPHRDGLSPDKGLLKTWLADGPPLLWKRKGLGAGFSSLAITQGKIFSMGELDDGDFLFALEDKADGKLLWSLRVGDPADGGGYRGPRCTPTVDEDLIFALGPNGDLVCAAVSSGKEVWRKNFGRDFGGQMMSGWGYSESPLVDGDRLLCTPGGRDAMIVALNKKTGDVIWKSALPPSGPKGKDGAAYASIVISNGGGQKQYVQLVGRGVFSVAADDGRPLWGYNRIANGVANIPTPVVKDDFVFCTTGYDDGGAALLKLSKSGKGVQMKEVWYHNNKELQNHHGGVVLVGSSLFFGHGHNNGFPVCVDFKTGKVVWGKQRGPGTGSAAVAYADDELYFRYQDGMMALIDATRDGYREKGTFKIPQVDKPSWSHPVIVEKRLYLREQDALYVYDLAAR